MNPSTSDALIAFAKVPEPGGVKTRLGELLTMEEAAALYEGFLVDALEQYDRLPVTVRLYLEEVNRPALRSLGVDRNVFVQTGTTLGERMLSAFAETFGAGYERVVIIGTDHPTLPSAFIRLAFEVLDEPLSVSIGPAIDGGYYLLGMNDLLPDLFREMTYSHAEVFDQTLARADRVARHLTILPEWYDVDTPDDLYRLAQELETSSDHSMATTRTIMRTLLDEYPRFFQAAESDAATPPEPERQGVEDRNK